MSVEQARQVRADRARVLGELSSGKRSVRDLLERPPSYVASMDVYDVLRAARGLGKERCRQVCERALVWPHLEVRDLSTAQIEGIVLHLPASIA